MFHNQTLIKFVFTGLIAMMVLQSLESHSIEPYHVKSIYFIPTDSIDRSEWLNLGEIMQNVQDKYKNEMERHGYSEQTFRLETDQNGDVIVHKVKGDRDSFHYSGSTAAIITEELERKGYNDIHTVYSIVIAGVDSVQNGVAKGVALSKPWGAWFGNGNSQYSGYSISAEVDRNRIRQIIQHELGHVFGLWHIVSVDQGQYIMGTLGGGNTFAFHEARWLSKNHYFTKQWNHSFAPKAIKFKGAELFDGDKIRFKATIFDRDNDGIFQTYAWVGFKTSTIGWNFHDGKDSTVIADFTDIDRNNIQQSDNITFQSMDMHGNWMIDFSHTYTIPEVANKNEDLDLADNSEEDDCIIVGCDFPENTDDIPRGVTSKFKLTTSWANIKSE